jgi:hypothetical protein
MRRTHILALSCLLVAPVALAQAPVSAFKMQLAQKMYDISGTDNVFHSIENDIGSNIMDGVSQGLGDKAGCSALQPELKSFHDRMDTLFTGLNDSSFRQEAARVYADTFSEEELKQIIAFQQSPAGQKLSKANTDIGKRIYQIAVTKAKTRENDIRATESTFVGNVQKIAATCPSAQPPAAVPPVKK